jgi:hypothetical protein
MYRLVGHTDLSLKLAKTHIEPQKRVNRKQPLAERNLRGGENCAQLIVERVVVILAEIALKRSIAAVFDVRLERQRGHPTPSSQRTCWSRSAASDSEPNTSSGIIRVGHR